MPKLDKDQFNFVLFRSHRKQVPHPRSNILIGTTEGPQLTSVNFLGIYLDEYITCKDHICPAV